MKLGIDGKRNGTKRFLFSGHISSLGWESRVWPVALDATKFDYFFAGILRAFSEDFIWSTLWRKVRKMLHTLSVPIIQASLAEGVSPPALAAAVSKAGGPIFWRAVIKRRKKYRRNDKRSDVNEHAVWCQCIVPSEENVNEEVLLRYKRAGKDCCNPCIYRPPCLLISNSFPYRI